MSQHVRANDYVSAKMKFRDGLISLRQHLAHAGMKARTLKMVEDLITTSTEPFVADPNAHYPDAYIVAYSGSVDRDRALENWEDMKILPQGFAAEAMKDYEMVVRNRIRYENPETPDEEITPGLYYVFPHLVKTLRD